MDKTDETIRLYRVGPTPAEASRLNTDAQSGWLNEYSDRTGVNQAAGRWFTSQIEVAETYRFDHSDSGTPLRNRQQAYPMRHVDVPVSEAVQWTALADPNLKRYTDSVTDYFVPREVANRAERTGVEREIVPPIPPYDPAKDVGYVEERRFHDKHFKAVDITPPEDRNQRSLGLER